MSYVEVNGVVSKVNEHIFINTDQKKSFFLFYDTKHISA